MTSYVWPGLRAAGADWAAATGDGEAAGDAPGDAAGDAPGDAAGGEMPGDAPGDATEAGDAAAPVLDAGELAWLAAAAVVGFGAAVGAAAGADWQAAESAPTVASVLSRK